MNDTGVIDQFLTVFTQYIDSGFGLLGGEVGFLSTTLIVIDVTIAALFWAWGTDEDVLQRLIKKTLYIGTFAFIIGNFSNLAGIMLQSFAGLGLQASGSGMAIGDFMRPGVVAATGLDAGQPLLDATADLVGPVGLFTNFVQILILLISWLIVVIAFFVLAIQVFVTIIEFKLVTLAGFVLLPFAFFGRTAFMAERVLGHIISSGIKVLVLAVITGIGTTLFTQFINAGLGVEPDIQQVMAIALAALTLLGLGIFGPSIANGIVSGGPQLGAGAAAGTAIAAGATIAGGIAGAKLAAGAAGSAMAGAATGGARAAGGASGAYAAGAAGKTGRAAAASGLANVAKSAASSAASPLRRAADSLKANYAAGKAGTPANAAATGAADGPPAWATAMKRRQAMTQGANMASHTLKGGDSHGGGSGPDISDKS
ncbi:TrbL Type IV secretory pathway, TrbL components [Sphingomonadaceae bacterium]|jgi:type IV secretion system protein TrbL|uniref:P-type conjugative transfer protein TrbL n=1 Tax=Sphingomonadales TaxID=204457 RepID=UPI00020EE7F4|nr:MULTISPECIES: P-type conjugative transfer protein TrbL [unclassified Novosphingobium]MBK9012573.1 P-type conjugative transfer protein TrbL [Novosphingobium sp.]MCH2239725.1 P-type conjugative transfer protein TrbL [Blastomonas sp.]OHC96486.1 MAG: P-type conjugative transfer protein TrbL [Sphingomonadales bacterium RIFCSPHIGHO2_01_FULL_65_20]CCA91241.1 type IV secretion system protein TrbL [Novosphingobium sp. PP1Y]